MASNAKVVYECSDCKKYYEDVIDFNEHECVFEGDPAAVFTKVQSERVEEGTDIDEDKRRTMFTCEDCGSWFLSMDKYKEHACYQKALEDEANNNNNGKTGDYEGSGKSTWGNAATLLLIDEYKTKSTIVDKGKMTKKAMWQQISKNLNDKGYSYNHEQVAGRWKSLVRAYKNVKDHNNKSGNNKKSFEYESQMDDLFGDDPTIKPVVIASSRKHTHSEENDSESLDDNSGLGPSNPKRQKNKGTSSTVVDILQNVIERAQKSKEEELDRREKMHREKLDAINQLLGVFKGQQDKK